MIPRNTTHLWLGDKFNQTITPGCLPDTLTHLRFGSLFNKRINPGTLPESLVYLRLDSGRHYGIPGPFFGPARGTAVTLPFTLPPGLTHLTFVNISGVEASRLPKSLKYIKVIHFNSEVLSARTTHPLVTHTKIIVKAKQPLAYRPLFWSIITLLERGIRVELQADNHIHRTMVLCKLDATSILCVGQSSISILPSSKSLATHLDSIVASLTMEKGSISLDQQQELLDEANRFETTTTTTTKTSKHKCTIN
eukprot:gene179-215_t